MFQLKAINLSLATYNMAVSLRSCGYATRLSDTERQRTINIAIEKYGFYPVFERVKELKDMQVPNSSAYMAMAADAAFMENEARFHTPVNSPRTPHTPQAPRKAPCEDIENVRRLKQCVEQMNSALVFLNTTYNEICVRMAMLQ